jgi:putative ABC transport system permease protein
MREFFYTALARVRDWVRPGASEADFDQEMETHLALAEEEKIRSGMSREDARREARAELGGVTQLREAARAARGLPWIDSFWLDSKLGLRMLRKSWGLTLVGGVAMAVTIGLGASIFTVWNTFAGTSLPLDDGERVVAIQPLDKVSRRVGLTPLGDFRRWRDTLKSVEHVSAMRPINPMVITRDGPAGPVAAAEMTASAFQVAGVRPLLGRLLIAQDEREGAEPVAVIGYDVWQSSFSSDREVLGQRIQIGSTPHTVVGVMPKGFRFPINQRLWTPLRSNPVGGAPPRSEDVFVFARLAPGVTLERAHAELLAIGMRPPESVAQPAERPEPRVVPYTAGIFPDVHDNDWATGVILLLAALLLVPPCANIAILVYARTVTRREEFAARSALGAGRARIVMQLFTEVLVLAVGAGIAGFFLARQLSGRLPRIVMPAMGPNDAPFWVDFTPSLETVVCVGCLSVLAAAIAGAVPAFHATGRWRLSGLNAAGHRGAGARLGKTWTALLAAQVAFSLAILPSAIEMTWGIFRPAIVGPAMPVDEFLTGSLVMDGDSSRFESLVNEAIRQLDSDGAITGVTASAVLLMEEPFADIEVEGFAGAGADARFNSVDRKFFEVFGARFLAGRGFDARDFGSSSRSVIVNRSFVDEIIGKEEVLGRQLRYIDTERTRQAANPPLWYEIVGVVEDFPGTNDGPMMYHPMAKLVHPLSLTLRTAAGVDLAARRFREVSTAIDPNLHFGRMRSIADMYWQRRSLDFTFGFALASVTMIVILFSIAGLYTLMAFIVAQRWREIGLRAALGAQPRRLIVGVFGRAMVPLLVGAIAGCAGALLLDSSLPIAEAGGQRIPGVVPFSAAFLIIVGLVAVARPARRAIRVNPTDALRVG